MNDLVSDNLQAQTDIEKDYSIFLSDRNALEQASENAINLKEIFDENPVTIQTKSANHKAQILLEKARDRERLNFNEKEQKRLSTKTGTTHHIDLMVSVLVRA